MAQCEALEGMYAHQVAAAVGYTMFLMEPDEERLESLPVWDCEEEEEEITSQVEKTDTKKTSSAKNLKRKSEIHQDANSRKKKK